MIFILQYHPNMMDEEKFQSLLYELHITDIVYLMIPQNESDYKIYQSISYDGDTIYNFSENITEEDIHNAYKEKIRSEIHQSLRLLAKKVVREDLYLDLDIEDSEHEIYYYDRVFYSKYKKYIHLVTTNNIAILTNISNFTMRYFYQYLNYYINRNITSIKDNIEQNLDPNNLDWLEDSFEGFYSDVNAHIYTLTDYWEKKRKRINSNTIIDSIRIELIDFLAIRSYTIKKKGNTENYSVDPRTNNYSDSFFEYFKENGFPYEYVIKSEKQELVKQNHQHLIDSLIEQAYQKREEEYEKDELYWEQYWMDSDYQGAYDDDPENEWNTD